MLLAPDVGLENVGTDAGGAALATLCALPPNQPITRTATNAKSPAVAARMFMTPPMMVCLHQGFQASQPANYEPPETKDGALVTPANTSYPVRHRQHGHNRSSSVSQRCGLDRLQALCDLVERRHRHVRGKAEALPFIARPVAPANLVSECLRSRSVPCVRRHKENLACGKVQDFRPERVYPGEKVCTSSRRPRK
jgi:hypothetical protein